MQTKLNFNENTHNSNYGFDIDNNTVFLQSSNGQTLPLKLFSQNSFANFVNENNVVNTTDFASLERQFSLNKHFNFTSGTKIESVQDIAWLFKELENESIEHTFLLYGFKDKSYMVQHLTSGGFASTLVDFRTFTGHVHKLQPDNITFVHNHPSGQLKSSEADKNLLNTIRKIFQDSPVVINDGVIINLRSGKFLTFNGIVDDVHNTHNQSQDQKSVNVYSFDKQIFKENYQPAQILGSTDVAKYLSSQKFGISDKTEALILNNKNDIVAKFLLPQHNQFEKLIQLMTTYGGTSTILYGNNVTDQIFNDYQNRLKDIGFQALDAIRVQSGNYYSVYEQSNILGVTPINDQSAVLDYLIPTSRKGDNFHMKVSKSEAEYLLYNDIIPDVMNKEYGDDEDWVGMTKDDFDEETGKFDQSYQKFEIDITMMSKIELESLLHELTIFENIQNELNYFQDYANSLTPEEARIEKENLLYNIQLASLNYDQEYLEIEKLKIITSAEKNTSENISIASEPLNNYKRSSIFTINDALEIQSNQLNGWQSVLKPEIFSQLNESVQQKNNLAKTPEDIKRGVEIEMILYNNIISKINDHSDSNVALIGELNVDKALAIQNIQLSEWNSVLTKDSFVTLKSLIDLRNEQAKNHYDVKRGVEITSIIQNDLIRNNFRNINGSRDNVLLYDFKQNAEYLTSDAIEKLLQNLHVSLNDELNESKELIHKKIAFLNQKIDVQTTAIERMYNSDEWVRAQREAIGLEEPNNDLLVKAHVNDFKVGLILHTVTGEQFTLLNKYDEGVWEARGSAGDKVIFENFAEHYLINRLERDFQKHDTNIESSFTLPPGKTKILNGGIELGFLNLAEQEGVTLTPQEKQRQNMLDNLPKDTWIELDKNHNPINKNQTTNINNIKNQNIMATQEFNQFEYLKNKIKYLGFGEDEKHHQALENFINGKEKDLVIKTTSNKTLPGNKMEYALNFSKSEQGNVFFNSYDANLTTRKNEQRTHNFNLGSPLVFTAKEALNLLEGRSVKVEYTPKGSEEKTSAFVNFDFKQDKNEYNQYKLNFFTENYKIDVNDIVEKAGLIFDKPEYKDNIIKSLEKGNIVKAKFEIEGKVIEGKAILNPQYKNIQFYQSNMARINTNKAIENLSADNVQEKANVREHSQSRSL